MRLILNGWPPVASHVTALLLGVSLAHLSWHEPPPSLHLAGRTIALGLPPSLLKHGGVAGLTRGAAVYALRTRPGTVPCRLSAAPMTLLEHEPSPLVSLSYAAVADLPDLVREAKADALLLRPAANGSAVPPCQSRPKVTYGAP